MNWANFLDNSGPVAPAAAFLMEEDNPPAPKNLFLVDDGGGGGACNWEAVGAYEDLIE